MGLLDRLRSGRDGHEEPRRVDRDDTPAVLDPPENREVIGPGVYNPAGAWNWAPPMPMAIPEMPLVLPPFEESLISHQLPEPFSSGLGHYVSEEAPAGFVEPVAILSNEPALGSEPGPGPINESFAELERSAHAVEPLPLAVGPPRAEPIPDEDQPAGMRDAALPVVRPQPSDVRSLVDAEPPVLPLLPLPSWPLPEEMRAQLEPRAEPEVHAPEPEPAVGPPPEPSAPTADLVGERPLVDAGVEPAVPAPQAQPAALEAQDQLPLAVPPPTRTAESPGPEPAAGRSDSFNDPGKAQPVSADRPEPAPPSPQSPAEAQTTPADAGVPAQGAVGEDPTGAATPRDESAESEDLPVAPLLGHSAPLVTEPASPSIATDADAEQRFEPRSAADVMPLVTPPAQEGEPERPGPPTEAAQPVVAPLVGATPPLASLPPDEGPASTEAAEQDLPTNQPVRSRSGLGTPMHSLPPSARSYDLTNMSRSEQLEMTRALMTGRSRAPGDLPLARPLQETQPEAGRTPAPMPGQLPAARIQPFPAETPNRTVEDLGLAGPAERIAPLVPFNDMTGPSVSREQAPEADADEESAAVRAEVGMRYGLDLARIPVDRSPQGALEAHFAGARAFTTDSGIVIPPSVGTLKAGEGAALLAHELTHVAQRMAPGRPGPVPDETSPEGRMLESEARQTEMVYAKGAQLPPWGLEPPAAGPGVGDPATHVAPSAPFWPVAASLPVVSPQPFGLPGGSPGSSSLPLASAGQTPGTDTEAIARTVLERVSALMPSPAPYTEVVTPASPPPAAAMAMQRAEVDTQPNQTAPAPTPEPGMSGTEAGLPRPSDEDLSNLSRWLYPLIRYRLKRELREDRERAGLLTDHYRRW